ncbi:MAG: hypothetical protein RIC89_21525 [Pseudomonadales bacterium]
MALDAASRSNADGTTAEGGADAPVTSLTERQQFWLDHLRCCDANRIPTKTYAEQHGFSVQAMYSARKDLVARGVLRPGGRGVCNPAFVRFARVKPQEATAAVSGTAPGPMPVAPGSTAFRIDLPNGTSVSFDGPLDAGTLHQVLQTAAMLS